MDHISQNTTEEDNELIIYDMQPMILAYLFNRNRPIDTHTHAHTHENKDPESVTNHILLVHV